MHSTIFQISMRPIDNPNNFSKNDLDPYFVDRYTDAITEKDDSDVTYLASYFGDGVEWINAKQFRVIDRATCMERCTDAFNKALDDLNDFIGSKRNYMLDKKLDDYIYLCCSAYSNERGFWFATEHECFTLQNLIRFYLQEGRTYYIGKTFDYHR